MTAPKWMPECPLSAIQKRAFLYQKIRQFFADKGVMEVETPVLSRHANTDRQIDVFCTQSINSIDDFAYLRTSPEFFHKRLLAAGSGDIFEIAKVFRLGEQSHLHNPEFSMLEWYRLDFKLGCLMKEMAALMQSLFVAFGLPELPVRHQTFTQLFEEYVAINPFKTTQKNLNDLSVEYGFHGADLSRDEALDFLFGVVIEPALPEDELLFVDRFPASQAALAQIDPDDANVCLRFELLWNGVELANGYQELTDATEQRTRFKADNEWRNSHGKRAKPIDENLLAALEAGLPQCSGVAVGLDRLLMHLMGAGGLSAILPFSADRA
ncbi:EF-P lysine aminoacylase EpmA [Marinicella rhabdoformis]|uniref:EF-P lysine aminoacylase EpmA n=1 Tax=Marinicella rhabdoformis TaxID=2580566 RepID=UPI0012AECD09|nr:EF-P lysine aminoacylase EpmA [Marinicella rhabdoformis]